jgi:hypothetical protein
MARERPEQKYEAELAALLEPGETQVGVCLGSHQKSMFAQDVVIFVITDKRLIVQPCDRKGRPNGESFALTPEQVASYKTSGAGGAGDPADAIMSNAAVKLQIRTSDGNKLKFMLMRGSGILGGLGGGEGQRGGAEALAAFLEGASDS